MNWLSNGDNEQLIYLNPATRVYKVHTTRGYEYIFNLVYSICGHVEKFIKIIEALFLLNCLHIGLSMQWRSTSGRVPKYISEHFHHSTPDNISNNNMEIPDSDEDEEILPPTPEKEPENNSQDIKPTLQLKFKSTTQFVERILTQLNLVGIQNQHQQGQEQEQERRDRDNVQENKQNPLSSLQHSALSQAKPLLLTLHCLLPNELLPALDILDRGLVRRIIRRNDDGNSDSDNEIDQEEKDSGSPPLARSTAESPSNEDMFFVLSVSEPDKKGHEVRLQAWNCTCASFLSSAFPLDADSDIDPGPETDRDIDIGSLGGQENCRLGGILTRGWGQSFPPLCKHILACVLLVRCPGLFVSGSQTWLVGDEELAAWCAGWGD